MSIYHGFDYQHERHLTLGKDRDRNIHDVDWQPVVIGCAVSGMFFSVIALVFLLFY